MKKTVLHDTVTPQTSGARLRLRSELGFPLSWRTVFFIRAGQLQFFLFSLFFVVQIIFDQPVEVLEMHISGRRQANTKILKNALDFYDEAIRSPKSVKLSENGEMVFVNALEGMKTLIYDHSR